MENQKIENVMNLAVEATMEEREKSLDLNVGYNQQEKLWEVIIKYTGDITKLKVDYGVRELLNEYAIVSVYQDDLDELANQVQVEYLEKPKRLFYNRVNGKRTSCISAVQRNNQSLDGSGVLVAIIDSGIDYMNSEFCNPDGTTRIEYLWDQSLLYTNEDEARGRVFTGAEIDEALLATVANMRELVPSFDFSGHGTEVASIAVGNNGVAYGAGILVVKLASPQKDGFPRTIELMEALDFVVRKAIELRQPLVINLSFGNTYGAHDGSSLLERYIDDISNYWKVSVVVSSGNEGLAGGHIRSQILGGQSKREELAVDIRQTGMNVQIWKKYEDDFDISIVTPMGEKLGPISKQLGVQRYKALNTELLIYYGEPSPYSVLQEIYIELIPLDDYITAGIWEVLIQGNNVVTGIYDLWLPSSGVLSAGTNFLRSTKEGSITIPSTAERVISVGAYDALTMNYAEFSGRGMGNSKQDIKPDIIAPGVNVVVSSVNENIRLASGTSFAAPFVTGSAAILMEWGIVQGRDPFLYGEKIKAYLHKGALPIALEDEYPNVQVGYGRMCLESSIPK